MLCTSADTRLSLYWERSRKRPEMKWRGGPTAKKIHVTKKGGGGVLGKGNNKPFWANPKSRHDPPPKTNISNRVVA